MSEERANQAEILEAIRGIGGEVKEIRDVLIGTAKSDTPGVLERLRRLESWVENEKKLLWIVGAIIFADVVSRIWALVVTVK